MKVLLLKGASQYGVLRCFIDEIADAFRAYGCEVAISDGLTWPKATPLRQILGHFLPVDFVYSINILGGVRDTDGCTLSDAVGAPFVIQYIDSPLHPGHWERLAATPTDTALLFHDRNHVAAVQSIFGPNRFAYVGFNPHAGMGPLRRLPQTAAEYAAQRPIAIFFPATQTTCERQPWEDFSAPAREILDETTDLVVHQPTLSANEALAAVLAAYGFDPREKTYRDIRPLAHYVEDWVRRQRRLAFLQALEKAKFPVTVCGKGFTDLPASFDYRGPVDFPQALALMGQTRMVLNASAIYGQGSHERPLCAMLAGAAAASDYSSFFAEEFRDGQEIVLFRWTHLDEDLEKIRRVIENPQALLAMAQAGQCKTAERHLWINRIETILHAARMAAAARKGHRT